MARLAPIEGLRAYLALWVVGCHVFWISGFEADSSPLLIHLLLKGSYAVQVFLIISGFVIFFLLDKQSETYGQFITRRFFRLFPLFIFLFLLAIPISGLLLWDVTHATRYWSPGQINSFTGQAASWWENIGPHMVFHFLMLHGVIPDPWLPSSAFAFLMPAWSMSVEWQFYLIAPAGYALAVSSRAGRRVALCGLIIVVFVCAHWGGRMFPDWDSGAVLPSFLPFVFLGAASYFLYKRNSARPIFTCGLPVFISFAIFLLVLGGKLALNLMPIIIWVGFFGLILEHPSSRSYRLIAPLFNNRVVQYIGRISYSLYLSHILIVTALQYPLLRFFPELSRPVHVGILLILTVPLSIAVSAVLYRLVEVPGMKLGQSLALELTCPRLSLARVVQRVLSVPARLR